MDDFKSVWREEGVWFAVCPAGIVYELISEKWSGGCVTQPAEWVVSGTVTFPQLSE